MEDGAGSEAQPGEATSHPPGHVLNVGDADTGLLHAVEEPVSVPRLLELLGDHLQHPGDKPDIITGLTDLTEEEDTIVIMLPHFELSFPLKLLLAVQNLVTYLGHFPKLLKLFLKTPLTSQGTLTDC